MLPHLFNYFGGRFWRQDAVVCEKSAVLVLVAREPDCVLLYVVKLQFVLLLIIHFSFLSIVRFAIERWQSRLGFYVK